MCKIPLLLLSLLFATTHVVAQQAEDSLYLAQITSLLKYTQNNAPVLHKQQFRDSTQPIMIYINQFDGNISTIYAAAVVCEQTLFLLKDDELLAVVYTLRDPDRRSSLPPSTTTTIYYKKQKKVYKSVSSNADGAKTCDEFLIEEKDFMKEVTYYRYLAQKAKK
jgi:hypothetical protein